MEQLGQLGNAKQRPIPVQKHFLDASHGLRPPVRWMAVTLPLTSLPVAKLR
jgi:hypothetical protein